MATLSAPAQRVHRVLKESGPRDLNVVAGLLGPKSTRAELERVVGELFLAGIVEWVSAKRWRRLSAVGWKARS